MQDLAFVLVKKSINSFFLLFHKLFALLEPVRIAIDVDNRAMMKNPVQNSGSESEVRKDFIPLGKHLVRGQDSRIFFVASGDELKKHIGTVDVHRESRFHQ